MNEVTEGQAVIVTDRRHPLSYEEGTVVRPEPDDLGRVRVHFRTIHGALQRADDWQAVELEVLAAMPSPGERYEWTDRNNSSRVPFTVGERFQRGHRYAGLFRVMSDDATPTERRDGHSSIASAAEIAKFADPVTTPAPPLVPASLAERMRDWADAGCPRPWPQDPGKPVHDFADEAQALQARADAAQAVLTTALAWEAAPELDHAALHAHVDAIRAYREAADS